MTKNNDKEYFCSRKNTLRYALKEKKRYYLGIFPKRRTPPPFGNPLSKKIWNMQYEIWNMKYEICNIYHVIVHFLPKKHCFWPKKALFFKFTKVLGFGKTPPPCWEKFPNDIVFFLRAYLSGNGTLPTRQVGPYRIRGGCRPHGRWPSFHFPCPWGHLLCFFIIFI